MAPQIMQHSRFKTSLSVQQASTDLFRPARQDATRRNKNRRLRAALHYDADRHQRLLRSARWPRLNVLLHCASVRALRPCFAHTASASGHSIASLRRGATRMILPLSIACSTPCVDERRASIGSAFAGRWRRRTLTWMRPMRPTKRVDICGGSTLQTDSLQMPGKLHGEDSGVGARDAAERLAAELLRQLALRQM